MIRLSPDSEDSGPSRSLGCDTARVLLVDDDSSQFNYTRTLLECLGDRYTLEWTSTYAAGFRRILAGGIDAAIVDYQLGGASGLDLVREAIAQQCDVPLIILTGQGDQSVDLQAMAIGATDYLDKADLTSELLDRTLRYAISHQASLRLIRRREAALRDNAERTAFALEAARIGVWEMDLDGGQLVWSDGMTQVTGFPPADFPRTADAFLDLVEPDDRATLREGLVAVTTERRPFEFQCRMRGPSGAIRWLEGKGRVFADIGAPARVHGVAIDITARRQLEEQFLQSQKMEAVGRLAGGVAHDFNNLLLAITGYSEMVADRLGPLHPSAVHVQKIWKAADSAASLTRQLLAFSRRQVLQPQVIDLNEIVGNIGSLLERLIGEEVRLETHLTTPLARVSADPGQMEQVVMNLVVNARDAMPGGGRLTIETAHVDLDEHYVTKHGSATVGPGPHVVLAISDTGVGMDESVQRRLFEPFFTTKERGKGTGLGLATIYGIVKQSGGSIWVYSEPGKGSCFKVYLPVATAGGAEPENLQGLPGGGSTRGTETILVVEDQPEVRAVICEILLGSGYTVLEAGSGAEAIAIGRQHGGQIDVLLTDVVMPGMSGRMVASLLQHARPALRVIYTSGYTADTIVHHGVLDPGLAFLQKPFSAAVLAQKIRDVMDGPRRPAV